MPEAARAAAWARLQAAIDRGEIPASEQRQGRELGWVAVLAAAAVLLWIVGTRGLPEREDRRDPASQAAHEAPATSEAQTTVRRGTRVQEAQTAEEPASPEVAAPPAPTPVVRRTYVPKDIPSLDAELALLRAAREALTQGEPAAALVSLERHRREFPGGLLVEERMLLRAQALCELGRRAEARAAAAELVRAFPSSPHARTSAGLCEE
ncbi:MAG TPA: hypothetical protein VIK91_08330 [Nannocystis sp.]